MSPWKSTTATHANPCDGLQQCIQSVCREFCPAGEQIVLPSKILDEDRAIGVALPVNYGSSGEKYPVLYLTDAQWQSDNAPPPPTSFRATSSFPR